MKDGQKATVFAKHLADVFQPHVQFTDEQILEFLESPAQSVEPLEPTTPKEIKEIRILNMKKAPGMDLMTSKILKELIHEDVILPII